MKKAFLLLWGWATLFAQNAQLQIWVVDGNTQQPIQDALVRVEGVGISPQYQRSKTTAPVCFSVPISGLQEEKQKVPMDFEMLQSYPNPIKTRVTLNASSPIHRFPVSIRLFNVVGQLLWEQEIMGVSGQGLTMDLEMKNFASGVYFFQMLEPGEVPRTAKVLHLGKTEAPPQIKILEIRPSEPSRGMTFQKPQHPQNVTITAFTDKSSKNSTGEHVGGFASTTISLFSDTTVTLALQKVPFSEEGHNMAPRAVSPPLVDGRDEDPCWQQAVWGEIRWLWLYQMPEPDDFTGRYKIVWTPDRLYFLVEIIDDTLVDNHPNPYADYYKDDCLEIFIDEDHSGGDHRLNHQAFAYHIALDYTIVDLGTSYRVLDLSNHAEVRRTSEGHRHLWEIGLKVFDKNFQENSEANIPVTLTPGKLIGLMLAYCDNDGGTDRESFIGSIDIPGPDKNLGWVNASVFGTLELIP